MIVAILNNNICINIIEVESLELAKELLGETIKIEICKEGFGIGSIYSDGIWSYGEIANVKLECPYCGFITIDETGICSNCGYSLI